MSGFFGFDTSLPPQPQSGRQGFGGFAPQSNDSAFGGLGAAEEEDVAVYTWGQDIGGGMDEMNDETFGDVGGFQDDAFAPSAPQPKKAAAQPKIASTQSRFGKQAKIDPFAASEDDFYSARPAQKSAKAPKAPKKIPAVTVAPPPPVQTTSASPMWGAAPSSFTKPSPPTSTSGTKPAGQIKTLEEVEAEMMRTSISHPAAPLTAPAPQKPSVRTLEDIEREMMGDEEPEVANRLTPQPVPAPREVTPTQHNLPGSGYQSQQAILDDMFPQLGAGAPPPGFRTAPFPGAVEPPRLTPEEVARRDAMHERVSAKIQSMSRYNNFMGASDKDFITRIQISQLVTPDPYQSDFYAQVFSAIRRAQVPRPGPGVENEDEGVLEVAPGFGLGVGAPAGNRFGKMGAQTMQKLSKQVKQLVQNRVNSQKNAGAALQGALGKINRVGSTAAPRPVLAVPVGGRTESRPVNALNQATGVTRQALTKKQVMFALEELYDAMLDLEQLRRAPPPPTSVEQHESWAAHCQAKVDVIWRRLMVMEPLDVSNPHPFISLLNAPKGQRAFPRILRHLPHSQCLTLLTLLIACFPQLSVVARAPPPPVSDASLLTKADRLDRARREAETDNFIHCVIPGVDLLINRCNLGLTAGLLGICAQRMDIVRVASTRPGVALFTALLSRAQSLVRTPPVPESVDPSQMPSSPTADELDQWSKTFAYLLQVLLPHLSELFPSAIVQKAAFGPGAYLSSLSQLNEGVSIEMERREAEVWNLMAAMAVNAPDNEQMNLVSALREKILHTVQAARRPGVGPQQADIMLRNVNMFLNGLGLDASMIE